MGKASRLKKERKATAATQVQQLISKASETTRAAKSTMDDMLIVMQLTTAIEMDDLQNFIGAVANLVVSGSDIYHFQIRYIDEDEGLCEDMSLLGYAFAQCATDVVAWLMQSGLNDQDPATKEHFAALMSTVDNGGHPKSAMDLYEALFKKVVRPASTEEAQTFLDTPFTAAALSKRSVQIALSVVHEFFQA